MTATEKNISPVFTTNAVNSIKRKSKILKDDLTRLLNHLDFTGDRVGIGMVNDIQEYFDLIQHQVALLECCINDDGEGFDRLLDDSLAASEGFAVRG